PTSIDDEEQIESNSGEEIKDTAEVDQELENEEDPEFSTVPQAEEILETEADVLEVVEAETAHQEEAPTQSADAGKPVTIIEDVVEKLESNEIKLNIPEGHSEVGNACLLSMAQELFISGDKINTAITQLVEDDQIPMAAQISYAVTNRKIANKVIPYELLKATYYGMHTFNNRKVFDKSTRLLNNVAPTDIEKLLELPVSGTTPYLMFVSCFQPALFGGQSIHPAMLLNSLPKSYFKSGTIDLIDNLWDIAKRGEQITIDLLLSDGEKSAKARFDAQRIEDWKDIILNTQKGYIPIRLAQISSLQNEGGLFKKVTDIMLTNDYRRDNEIHNFITSYKEPTDSAGLLDKLLNDVDVWHGDGITRIGRQTFHNKLTDLLDIAKDWLESKPAASRRTQLEDFCRQFNTRLQQVTLEFKAISEDPKLSWDQKAGAHFVAVRLEYLYKVIRGDIAVWKYPRVKGWYYHPRQIASLYVEHQDDTAPEVIQWLLAHIGFNIRSRMHLEMAIDKGYVRLSELLRRYLKDDKKDIPDIDTDAIFTRYKKNINQRCSDIDMQMDNALLTTDLMDPDVTEMYRANISEIQEALERLEILDETKELEEGLDLIEAVLKEKTASTKESLIKRLDEGVAELKVSVPDEPLPVGWIEDFHVCLENSNLPVANEMIDELNYAVKRQQRISRVTVKNVPVLAGFIAHQKKIYDGVKDAITRGRGIDRLIKDEPETFGLTFKKDTPTLKDAIKSLEHWRSNKPQQKMSKEFYNRIVSILYSIGIKLEFDQYEQKREVSLKYRATRGISSMEMMVKHSHSSRPFEIFGTNYKIEKSIPVLITYKEWSNDSVHDYMKSEGIYGDVMLISAVPLQMTQRNEFAKYFKAEERMVLLIDIISLLYLASQEEDQADNTTLRNYLWLAAPFTYFNPYAIGDTAQPTSSSEMVYGRERQIADLLKMKSGRAIVYGGRQLGKSTIMQQVEKNFHDPDRNKYAFYKSLDDVHHDRMEDSEDSKDSHDKATLEIWKFIHSQLVKYKTIKTSSAENNTDRLYDESRDAIIAHPKSQFIVIFDEIDPILNIDSKFGFLIMRRLREMVVDSQINGRFKVIIGGLQNVRRFENHSNYPLTQLGGSIQVSIMPTQEALQLVVEPMRAAGYMFENEQIANLVLAITNRHPGLIQIFCYQLIKHLSHNSREPVGQRIVHNFDIQATYNDSHVQGLIKNRFKMTLNLDPRYAVIVYSIIYEDMGAKPFTVSSAKEWASIWDSDAFEQLSDRQFEAFLNELEGLGVLTKYQDARYALRNTNILKLLVDPQKNDVVNELKTALDELANYDPLDRHAYKSKEDRPPSPLSYRDEKSILGIIDFGPADIHSNIPEETSSEKFTSTLIVGSDAQGLNQLKLALPALCEEEKLDHEINIYKLYQHSTHEYESAVQFERKLINPLIDKSKSQGPQLALIRVDGKTGIADLLAMIDAANNHSHTSESPLYPIRLVFMLDPAAYWTWLYNPQHTKNRESQQPFIHLGYWRSTAIRYLLEKIHLNDVSTDSVNEAYHITHGWYYKLNEIAAAKKAKSNLTSINQFSDYVIPIDTVNKKESKQFLKDCGFYDCKWVQLLLSQMIHFNEDQYSKEDICFCAEEADLDSTITMIKWMTQMGLLVRLPRVENTREGPFYKIAPSVLHAVKRCYLDESE
ncbi:MAG: hypothetical protein HN708_12835, partial [Candidatus Marinimicrobia bacterium]|nr:hypothetical protein [Candidatus Neomarinimicrobiota bacterium]